MNAPRNSVEALKPLDIQAKAMAMAANLTPDAGKILDAVAGLFAELAGNFPHGAAADEMKDSIADGMLEGLKENKHADTWKGKRGVAALLVDTLRADLNTQFAMVNKAMAAAGKDPEKDTELLKSLRKMASRTHGRLNVAVGEQRRAIKPKSDTDQVVETKRAAVASALGTAAPVAAAAAIPVAAAPTADEQAAADAAAIEDVHQGLNAAGEAAPAATSTPTPVATSDGWGESMGAFGAGAGLAAAAQPAPAAAASPAAPIEPEPVAAGAAETIETTEAPASLSEQAVNAYGRLGVLLASPHITAEQRARINEARKPLQLHPAKSPREIDVRDAEQLAAALETMVQEATNSAATAANTVSNNLNAEKTQLLSDYEELKSEASKHPELLAHEQYGKMNAAMRPLQREAAVSAKQLDDAHAALEAMKVLVKRAEQQKESASTATALPDVPTLQHQLTALTTDARLTEEQRKEAAAARQALTSDKVTPGQITHADAVAKHLTKEANEGTTQLSDLEARTKAAGDKLGALAQHEHLTADQRNEAAEAKKQLEGKPAEPLVAKMEQVATRLQTAAEAEEKKAEMRKRIAAVQGDLTKLIGHEHLTTEQKKEAIDARAQLLAKDAGEVQLTHAIAVAEELNKKAGDAETKAAEVKAAKDKTDAEAKAEKEKADAEAEAKDRKEKAAARRAELASKTWDKVDTVGGVALGALYLPFVRTPLGGVWATVGAAEVATRAPSWLWDKISTIGGNKPEKDGDPKTPAWHNRLLQAGYIGGMAYGAGALATTVAAASAAPFAPLLAAGGLVAYMLPPVSRKVGSMFTSMRKGLSKAWKAMPWVPTWRPQKPTAEPGIIRKAATAPFKWSTYRPLVLRPATNDNAKKDEGGEEKKAA